jgi:hypothetical protein
MLTREIKLLTLSALLVILGLATLYTLKSMDMRKRRENFSSKLGAEVEKKRSSNNIVEVRLRDMTDFTWDRVYVFPPYTRVERINEDLSRSPEVFSQMFEPIVL